VTDIWEISAIFKLRLKVGEKITTHGAHI